MLALGPRVCAWSGNTGRDRLVQFCGDTLSSEDRGAALAHSLRRSPGDLNSRTSRCVSVCMQSGPILRCCTCAQAASELVAGLDLNALSTEELVA